MPRKRYNLNWPDGTDDLQIEFIMIRSGGYRTIKGIRYGEGLFHHYREAMRLMWPEDDDHRWSDLCLRRKTENAILVLMGSSDSNKTYLSSKYVLTNWWRDSEKTLWIVSSTELRGAELRNWGAIKGLFNRARARYPWLPGTVLESKNCITSEEISEDGSEGRLLTKGIVFVPCKKGGSWVGMGAYAGIKPMRGGTLGHFGDEAGFMAANFLDAYSNWYGKENFEALLDGNPTDLDDPLCQASRPTGGWESWQDTGKTQEWRSEFYNAWVIALDGRDSPNFDYPEDQPVRYKYLIGRKKHEAVKKLHGPDHPLYWQQCVGKPVPGTEKFRVIPHSLPESSGAFGDVVWEGSSVTDVVSLDAAYGGAGGDRCVLYHGRFGLDVDGRNVIACKPPVIVPVSVRNLELPEDQIAKFCANYCNGFDVPPEHFYFDGRSTLAVSMARLWSANVNVVDFGGPATKRPVSNNEFVWDGDVETRRLLRCDEKYNKFVTELWFAIYYLMIGKQLRGLTREVAQELHRRLWRYAPGKANRIEVETKAEMKERTSESPDLADALVTMVEGARRLGFQIEVLKDAKDDTAEADDYLEREAETYRKFIQSSELGNRR